MTLDSNSVTEGTAPVIATLSVNVAPASDAVVSLSSSDINTATAPATVTLPAGQTSVTFPVTTVDDGVLGGTRTVTLSAATSGYVSGSTLLLVNDNETATLGVNAPASTIEGQGSVQGVVTIDSPPAVPVAVTLTSSDTTALQIPATVTIPAGQTSAAFTINVIQNTSFDGTRFVSITAHVANWTDGVASITALDNKSTNLALALPPTVVKGATGVGMVTIAGTLGYPLVVSLSSDIASRLTVPATVTIPAGSTSAAFNLTAPQDSLTNGTALVTITASAINFTGTSGAVSVLDANVHHFGLSSIASPQGTGSSFLVSITAMDVNGVTITSYAGTPSLTAAGTGGTDTVAPAAASGFVAGVWTGYLTVSPSDTNVVVTVSDGAGHNGVSNAFTVTPFVATNVVEPVPRRE